MNSAPDLNALIAMADHLLLSGQTAEAVEDLEKYAIAFNLSNLMVVSVSYVHYSIAIYIKKIWTIQSR